MEESSIVKIDIRQIKLNQGIWWWLRRVEGDSEIHIFSLTQMLELTGFFHTSDFFHFEFTKLNLHFKMVQQL